MIPAAVPPTTARCWMIPPEPASDPRFRDAVEGFRRGDFSRLEPLFDGDRCRIVEWYDLGYFDDEPAALAEALSCACFLGRTDVVDFLLARGVNLVAGNG